MNLMVKNGNKNMRKFETYHFGARTKETNKMKTWKTMITKCDKKSIF